MPREILMKPALNIGQEKKAQTSHELSIEKTTLTNGAAINITNQNKSHVGHQSSLDLYIDGLVQERCNTKIGNMFGGEFQGSNYKITKGKYRKYRIIFVAIMHTFNNQRYPC